MTSRFPLGSWPPVAMLRSALAPVVVVALAGASMAQTFLPPVAHATLGDPRGLVLGDFDGDGAVDAAVALRDAASIALHLGSATGFEAPVALPVAARPVRIAAGDVDADGDLDLVTVHAGTGPWVSVLIGHGDGTFGAFFAGPALPEAPTDVALVQLDGDGFADLVVGALASVHVHRGLGDGTFSGAVTLDFGPPLSFDHVRDFAVDDVDEDGDLDVVAAVGDQGTRVVLNHGSFAFTSHWQPGWWGYQTFGVDLADIDEDGLVDLFWIEGDALETGSEMRGGDGDGTFDAWLDTVFLAETDFVRFANLDGDGDPDFVSAWNHNAGQGYVRWSFGGPGAATLGGGTLERPARYEALEVADLEGDGFDDVVLTDSASDALVVLRNVGCPGPATVIDASPSNVPTVAWPATELSVVGCDLDAVLAVGVGGVPSAFEVAAGGLALVAHVPQGLPLGRAAVELSGASGALAAFSIDVVPPDAPALALEPALLSASAPAALHVGALPGDLALLFLSPDLVPSSLPGLVDLAIGNGFASLSLVVALPIPSAASAALALPTAAAPVGATLHFQAVVLRAAGGTEPLAVTNPVSATVAP